MPKSRVPESQLSFIAPDDAVTVHLMRRFLAEASRIWESRTGRSLEDALTIKSPQDAYEFLKVEMEGLEQEQLRVVNLNTRNKIISTQMIYQGSLNMAVVRIGEVFRPAIIDNAMSVIAAHNHPSGDPTPSPEDVKVTQQLVQAGKLLDVEVLDHLIIGKGQFVSLKERGLGFEAAGYRSTATAEDKPHSRRKRVSPR